MKRVVLDTNVLVSALWSKGGNAAKILDTAVRGEILLFYDARILKEYKEVLNRPKFAFSRADIGSILNKIRDDGIIVAARPCLMEFSDPDDKKFYEVAKESGAVLVTGNLRHYPCERFIMSISEFLADA